MTIYLTGDNHGMYDIDKIDTDAWEQRDWRPTEDDYLIVLGDIGCIYHTQPWDWPEIDRRDQEVIDVFSSQPWTVLFVDGNHENHDTLNDIDIEKWNGGFVHKITPKLIHLMRGQVYEIDGMRFFTMGGAHSPDWEYRAEGTGWWPAEMPSEEEYEEALSNLYKNDDSVNIILSHTCPTDFLGEILDSEEFAQPDELTDFFQEIYDEIDFDKWLFAHFHEELFSFSDSRMCCLFGSLVELDTETMEVEVVD